MKVLFLIGVVIFIVARLVQNYLSEVRASDNLSMASSDGDYAANLAETLDITVVVKKNVDTQVIQSALANFNLTQLNNFKLNSTIKLDPDTYLCLTLAEYEDVESTSHKSVRLASHLLDLNFKIKLDHESKTCRFYSDLHTNLTDKMLREEFANLMWTKLTSMS